MTKRVGRKYKGIDSANNRIEILTRENQRLVDEMLKSKADADKWRALEAHFSVRHRVKPPYLVAIELLTGGPT